MSTGLIRYVNLEHMLFFNILKLTTAHYRDDTSVVVITSEM